MAKKLIILGIVIAIALAAWYFLSKAAQNVTDFINGWLDANVPEGPGDPNHPLNLIELTLQCQADGLIQGITVTEDQFLEVWYAWAEPHGYPLPHHINDRFGVTTELPTSISDRSNVTPPPPGPKSISDRGGVAPPPPGPINISDRGGINI